MSGTMDARNAWLLRVLGVAIPATAAPGGGGSAPDWATARAAWQDASDTVDGQIAALQKALRDDGDETLKHIAEFGLNGVTGNHKVPLLAAMSEIGAGDPAALQRGGPKALAIVRAFRAHLDGSEEVEVCDDNPFDVPVSIRATLGGALAQMEAALSVGVGR